MRFPGRSLPIPLIAAMVVGLLVATVTGWFIYKHIPTQSISKVTVIVAARNISIGEKVTQDDITRVSTTYDSFDSSALNSTNEIIGKISQANVTEGGYFYRDNLIDPKLVLEYDERALAVPIKDLAQLVGNSIKPGTKVDVYWVTNLDTPGALLAPGVRLLELRTKDGLVTGDESQSQNAIQAGVQQVVGNNPVLIPGIAVLAVKSEQVGNIARSLAGGSIVLAKVSQSAAPPAAPVQPNTTLKGE